MSKTVWKFDVPMGDMVTIQMPVGAEILCMNDRRGTPYLWAAVDCAALKETRRFQWAVTGHALRAPPRGQGLEYVGSIATDVGTFHLFEYVTREDE
jgi:hypothetical protein